MSIRLKDVKWEESGRSTFTIIGGNNYMIHQYGEDFFAVPGLGFFQDSTLDATKAACEQHALERIREAVEVEPDHIGDATKMIGWQPISTAPRDGLYPILICGGTYQTDGQIHGLSVGDRVIVSRFVHCINTGDSPWIDMLCPAVSILNPAHWMPLPKPPREVSND